MTKENKVFRTLLGWCKRMPEGIIGPFKSKLEAMNAYGPFNTKQEKETSEQSTVTVDVEDK